MAISVYFTVAEVDPADVAQRTVVVIDVIRATTTIVEALSAGAKAVYPVAEIEEALRLATSLGRDDALLCGERKGVMIEGYVLGNSPREFTAERVAGKDLVMTTTNGTRALAAAMGGSRVLVASFTNLSAVSEALGGAEDVAIVCAGREDRFAMEDAVCAGILVRRLHSPASGAELNDAARAAHTLTEGVTVDVEFLSSTAAGRQLARIDMAADLELCADVDRHARVPEMVGRTITLAAQLS
jgi:2-phosphosulfolactate phosphatase